MLIPIPFPLASGRYEVGPAMRRFGQAGQGFPAEQGHFQPDEGLAATLAAKLAVLRKAHHEAHLFADGDTAGLRAALQASFHLLADEHPDLVTADADGATMHHLGYRLENWSDLVHIGTPRADLADVAPGIFDWLQSRTGMERLADALALSVQEDLAITRGPQGDSPDMLEWLAVCLPSKWIPAEKIGRSFGIVHEPVANNQGLIGSQHQIVRAMIHAGPFVRYVWGLHRDGELCHNPRLHNEAPWLANATPAELGKQGFFRVERQTTHGFPELNRALFTIRYWSAPLADIAADPWQRERLASALSGMDEAAMAYKGLTQVRDKLVTWLETRT